MDRSCPHYLLPSLGLKPTLLQRITRDSCNSRGVVCKEFVFHQRVDIAVHSEDTLEYGETCCGCQASRRAKGDMQMPTTRMRQREKKRQTTDTSTHLRTNGPDIFAMRSNRGSRDVCRYCIVRNMVASFESAHRVVCQRSQDQPTTRHDGIWHIRRVPNSVKHRPWKWSERCCWKSLMRDALGGTGGSAARGLAAPRNQIGTSDSRLRCIRREADH